jgi:hypothetical protein
MCVRCVGTAWKITVVMTTYSVTVVAHMLAVRVVLYCSCVTTSVYVTPLCRLTMGGRLEPPLFRIHKHVVHQVCALF